MKGYIHSIESCGTVDGPGLRFVVFLQGCPLRCQYCHNPDTWQMNTGQVMSVDEIIEQYNKKKDFYKNGGITLTGGEPLMQTEFVTELFRKCKEQNIHTCIDTSGITFIQNDTTKMDTLMQCVDLVLLDLKHINNEGHISLTGVPNTNILQFAKYLSDKQIPVWVRHVVVPTITQNDDYLFELGKFIGTLKNVKALDVLPYHVMGVAKYAEMNLEYPLAGLDPLEKEEARKAREIIISGIKESRSQH